MAVLAALSTPNTADAPDCAPRRIVAELPDIELEVVQFERNGAVAVPYLWMRGASTGAFESALSAEPRITSFRQLERTAEAGLYKLAWEVDSPLIGCVSDAGGIVMQARGTASEWQLKVWFEDGSAASRFQRCCTDRAVPLQVDRLSSLADVVSGTNGSVSERQRETLVAAYRAGYFEEPRRVSQQELADELGISSSAVGGRIRRGLANLVRETVVD